MNVFFQHWILLRTELWKTKEVVAVTEELRIFRWYWQPRYEPTVQKTNIKLALKLSKYRSL